MSSRIASREAKHEIASPSAQELALTKTLEALIMEREQLVHETARLGQEVRQLRQAASGDAESQAAQVLALKEIVVALTRENLQLVQQGGTQLAAPQPRRQPSVVSPSTSVNSRSSTRSVSRVWQENAQDGNTDDFAVFDDDTGVDDGFGRDFSFKVEDFQSELDAAKRCSLPDPEPEREPEKEIKPKPETEKKIELEPEPEPKPEVAPVSTLTSKLTAENTTLRSRGKEQQELVQSLRISLRASQHEVNTLRRSLEERTRALVYWSTQVRGRVETEATPLKIEELERIARADAATAGERGATRKRDSHQDTGHTESRHDPSKGPRGSKPTSGAAPKPAADRQSADADSVAAVDSVPKRQSSDTAAKPHQVEEGEPPQLSEPLAQPMQRHRATKGGSQQLRATSGSDSDLSNRNAAASTLVTDSRDSSEDVSAAAGRGRVTSASTLDTANPTQVHREAASDAARKQVPSNRGSEEEDCASKIPHVATTPKSTPAGGAHSKRQELPAVREGSSREGGAAASGSPKVPVTSIASSDADGAGFTGVLGYVTLPGPAHKVTFQTVRKMIDAGAGGALHNKPADFVFMRGGAPVGRKQEAKFTVLAKQGEPALVVIRAKSRTA